MLSSSYARANPFSASVACMHLLRVFFKRTLGVVICGKHFVGQELDLPVQRWKGTNSICHAALPVPLHGTSVHSPQTLSALMLRLSISHSIQQYDFEKLQKWPFEDLSNFYPLWFVREWCYLEPSLHNYCGHVFVQTLLIFVKIFLLRISNHINIQKVILWRNMSARYLQQIVTTELIKWDSL